MSINEIPVRTLAGEPTTLGALSARSLLVVNVASQCGNTPQYEGLERLYRRYAGRGFAVAGFPCNQFGGQEPGTPEEIGQFCRTRYGVTFPMFDKVEVRGAGQHPLYAELTRAADADGRAGKVQWNFEKFLVSGSGDVVARFRPGVTPEDAVLVRAIEASLAEAPCPR
jgi:glutathione peroxidase